MSEASSRYDFASNVLPRTMNAINQSPEYQSVSAPSSGIQYKPETFAPYMEQYGKDLFTNIAASGKATEGAQRKKVIDNSSRFEGLSGSMQQLLKDVGRDTSDQMLNLRQQTGLKATQEDLTDRRTQQANAFQAAQNDLAREAAAKLAESQLRQDAYQYQTSRGDNLTAQTMKYLTGI